MNNQQLGAKQLAVGTIVSTILGYVLIRYMLGLPIIPTDGQLFGSSGEEFYVRSTDYGYSPIGTLIISFLMAIGSISMALYKIIMSLVTNGFSLFSGFSKGGTKIADGVKDGLSDFLNITQSENKKKPEEISVNNVTSKPDCSSSGSCCVKSSRRIILVIEPNGEIRRDAVIEHMINTPDVNNISRNAFWSGNKELLLETFDKVHSNNNGENNVR